MFGSRQKQHVAAVTDYFARLGLSYVNDGMSKQSVVGPYRGVVLRADGERRRDGSENTGTTYYGDTPSQSYRPLYRDYLQVGLRTSSTPPVVIFHRGEYALAGPHK